MSSTLIARTAQRDILRATTETKNSNMLASNF